MPPAPRGPRRSCPHIGQYRIVPGVRHDWHLTRRRHHRPPRFGRRDGPAWPGPARPARRGRVWHNL